LSGPRARILPTVFSERCGISLYSATGGPIPEATIASIISAFKRFQHICKSFGVPPTNIRLVATEATRNAHNSAKFTEAVVSATGLKIDLLSKEDEGRIGAWGIASSIAEICGLVMDLGGGSTQLSWIISKDQVTQIAQTPISMPYGAAALTKRLETEDKSVLHAEVSSRLSKAFESLQVPDQILRLNDRGGVPLYLSGGGFRGFGYLLLSEHPVQPYPIPIINGFSTSGNHFTTLACDFVNAAEKVANADNAFRISSRRAGQLPAVAFLVTSLLESLPINVSTVTFAQGGVREGVMYSTLPQDIRAQDPLVIATQPYAPVAAQEFTRLLTASMPPSSSAEVRALTPAVSNMLHCHAAMSKESRASCALHCTSTGVLTSVHGLTHQARALLALILCARWGDEVPDSNLKSRLQLLVGSEMEFWCRYLGAIAGIIGSVYPAGRVVPGEGRIDLEVAEEGSNEKKTIRLTVLFKNEDPVTTGDVVGDTLKEVEMVGKKKRCGTYRRKVAVVVSRKKPINDIS
jgi:retrograde regulation protein 2